MYGVQSLKLRGTPMTFEINTSNGPAVQSTYGPILLADLFDADTERGILIWKRRSVELFANKQAFATWNARWAGTAALSSDHISGYKHGSMFGRATLAHRVLFAIHNGKWPTNQIDHVNGVRSDNKAGNLRDVTKSQNGRNMAMRKTNTSGVIGVFWRKREQKWSAEIKSAGKQISLGYFADIESATAARKAAELACGYHPNHGRAA